MRGITREETTRSASSPHALTRSIWMAMSPNDTQSSDREDLFTTVERLRDGKCVPRNVMDDARAEAAALASTLKGREDAVGTLLKRLEDVEEKFVRKRASAMEAELATRRLAEDPPSIAEDLWLPEKHDAGDGANESMPAAVDAWGPEGDPRVNTEEPDVAARARRLVALASDLFDQEKLLVEVRGRARRETKTSRFEPKWGDAETSMEDDPGRGDQRKVV